MSKDLEIEGYYLKQAQGFIDMLVDKDILSLALRHDQVRALEEYFAYVFQSQAYSASKLAEIMAKKEDK